MDDSLSDHAFPELQNKVQALLQICRVCREFEVDFPYVLNDSVTLTRFPRIREFQPQ
jgi:hypothetical protein